MTARMNWNDLNFTAADVVKLVTGIAAGIIFASTINANINNLGGDVQEIKQSQAEFQKAYKLEQDAIRSQISILSSDLKILNLRIEMVEKRE